MSEVTQHAARVKPHALTAPEQSRLRRIAEQVFGDVLTICQQEGLDITDAAAIAQRAQDAARDEAAWRLS